MTVVVASVIAVVLLGGLVILVFRGGGEGGQRRLGSSRISPTSAGFGRHGPWRRGTGGHGGIEALGHKIDDGPPGGDEQP